MAVETWHLGGPTFPAEESTYEVASPISASFSSTGFLQLPLSPAFSGSGTFWWAYRSSIFGGTGHEFLAC